LVYYQWIIFDISLFPKLIKHQFLKTNIQLIFIMVLKPDKFYYIGLKPDAIHGTGLREGVSKVACTIFCCFFVGERRFAKTPGDLTKKTKNSTTTCWRPTA